MADTLPHDRAIELLPWLANGTLAAGERDAVREHSRSCVICRREIEALESFAERAATRAAMDGGAAEQPPDMRRINARIDALIEREHRGAALLDMLRGLVSNRWRAAFAVQSLVLAAVAAAWFMTREPAAEYTTLTSMTTPEELGTGIHLRVVFDPGIDAVALAALLETQGLDVAAGPSPRGVYTLAFTAPLDAAGRDAVRAALAADPRVLFVQPVEGRHAQ